MREGWKVMQLGELITTKKGYAFKSAWYQDKGVPVVRVSDFTDNSISDETIFYINEELASEHSSVLLNTKDIIVQTVGSWQHNPASIVGKVVRVPNNLNNSLLNQNAVKLIPNGQIEKDFLYYRLKDESFKYHNLNFAQGAANQASITLETIKCFKINLPPLETQKKIASILSGYDDLIENNIKRIKILEEMAQQTYEEWFVRMRFPGHESATINKETGLPEGWETDFVSNQLGKVKSTTKIKSSEFQNEGNIPVVDQSRSFIAGFTNDDSSLIEYSGIPYIVFGDHTRILKLINFDFARGADGTQIVLSKNPKMPQHLFYFSLMNIDLSNYHYARHYKYLKDSEIIIPTEGIAQRFEELAKKNFDAIQNLRTQNQRLREARDILLPRLMMGMIEV
ncbi:restriction endonuclease subunit S [Empedobacter sp. ULE_I140]